MKNGLPIVPTYQNNVIDLTVLIHIKQFVINNV